MTASILVLTRSIPHHSSGGMETLTWSLATEWARAGRTVELVTTVVPGADGPFIEDGVAVVPLTDTRPGRYSRTWWSRSREYWQARQTSPDVVLSVSAGGYAVARDRSRHPRSPFVLQAHGTATMEIGSKLRTGGLRSLATAPRNALVMPRDLARYRDFDRIVAVGEPVVESLTSQPLQWAVPADRVRLIHNGVRVAEHAFEARARHKFRAALGVADGVTVVSSVGRLHVQKRLDRILRAAAELRARGAADRYRFVLVGDGPDESRLRALTADLGLTELVTFAGRADRREVRGWFSAADVALLTTARLEGLPMAVLEALATGLPCVVPTGSLGSSALARVLHQVDPADPRALADVLSELAGRAPGAPIGPDRPAGPDRPRASLLPVEFTLDHCARSYLALFDELAPPPVGESAGTG